MKYSEHKKHELRKEFLRKASKNVGREMTEQEIESTGIAIWDAAFDDGYMTACNKMKVEVITFIEKIYG